MSHSVLVPNELEMQMSCSRSIEDEKPYEPCIDAVFLEDVWNVGYSLGGPSILDCSLFALETCVSQCLSRLCSYTNDAVMVFIEPQDIVVMDNDTNKSLSIYSPRVGG